MLRILLLWTCNSVNQDKHVFVNLTQGPPCYIKRHQRPFFIKETGSQLIGTLFKNKEKQKIYILSVLFTGPFLSIYKFWGKYFGLQPKFPDFYMLNKDWQMCEWPGISSLQGIFQQLGAIVVAGRLNCLKTKDGNAISIEKILIAD